MQSTQRLFCPLLWNDRIEASVEAWREGQNQILPCAVKPETPGHEGSLCPKHSFLNQAQIT